MEVILIKDVEKIGKIGEVIKVKDGFARNYLLPNKLAYLATPANLKRIEQLEKKRKQDYEKDKVAAQELADKLSKISCTVSVEVNDLEKMYGTVKEIDIVRAVEVEGFTVDKNDIILDKPISELGIFEVKVKLHPEVITNIRLWVTKK